MKKVEVNSEDKDTAASTVVVRQYGLRDPAGWDDACAEILWKQNQLWNQLVEIEHAARQAYREAMTADPAVATLEVEMQALGTERDALVEERKRLRQTARKRVKTPDLDEAIKAIGVRRREDVGPRLKAARQDAKERHKPAIDAVEQQRWAKVKEACNTKVNGLWWPNCNAVHESYKTARRRAMKDGTELRFHRFTGEGRFTYQIQGGIDVAKLFDGSRAQISVRPVDPRAWSSDHRGERRRLARTELTLAVDSFVATEGYGAFKTLRFPMMMHRPIPDGVRIKYVVVSRKRVGSQFRWAVTFTCTTEPQDTPLRTNLHAAAALNFGFRLMAGGELRVAMRIDTDGQKHEYRLPADMLDGWRHLEALRQKQDEELNAVLTTYRALVNADNAPEPLRDFRRILGAPKLSARVLVRLWAVWREHAAEFHPDALATLNAWRRKNRRLYEEEANLRDKLNARRTDLYRVWALDIAQRYGALHIEDTNYQQLGRIRDQADGEVIVSEIRRLARIASPGAFRKYIELAAAKTGASIIKHAASRMTLKCHSCGHEQNLADGKNARGNRLWTCGHCGETWDQDENFCINLLSAPDTSERSGTDRDAGERSQAATR